MKKLFLILLISSFLASCKFPTKYERDPADIGYGRDDMKQSKCACIEFYRNGEKKWLF